jgi:hypothetical protein
MTREGLIVEVILSPFVIGPAAATNLIGSAHWVVGIAFVLIAGFAVGMTSAAQEARRTRLRWHALSHRLPFDSRLAS